MTYTKSPVVFRTPTTTFSEYCTKTPKRGDWIPVEEDHYIVIRGLPDGSFDVVPHPRSADIAARTLDFSDGPDAGFAKAREVATDPATIAAVLAAHPESTTQATRRPVDGWANDGGVMVLDVAGIHIRAAVGDWTTYFDDVNRFGRGVGDTTTAQLAAEDALFAIADAINALRGRNTASTPTR